MNIQANWMENGQRIFRHMGRWFIPPCAMIIGITVFLSITPAQDSPAIGQLSPIKVLWLDDYEQSKRLASERGLPLLILIVAEGCPWCAQLEEKTLCDPSVSQVLAGGWICLRVNGKSNPAIVNALKLRNFPTLVYADCEGKILASNEGYIESAQMLAVLEKLVGSQRCHDWMKGAFKEAKKAQFDHDYSRSMAILRVIIGDGGKIALQKEAQCMLMDMEKQAALKAIMANKLADSGKVSDAIEAASDVVKLFGGTLAAQEGGQLLARLASRSVTETNAGDRVSNSKYLLGLVDLKKEARCFGSTLDILDQVQADFPDSEEGKQAREQALSIRMDPEKLKLAADQMAERLAGLYMGLAEAWVAKGQPQQGIYYMERVIITFPGSRYSEAAQSRLAQIQGPPGLGGSREKR